MLVYLYAITLQQGVEGEDKGRELAEDSSVIQPTRPLKPRGTKYLASFSPKASSPGSLNGLTVSDW